MDYGAGRPAGIGAPDGFDAAFPASRLVSAGSGLDWSPVRDLHLAAELAWTQLHLDHAGKDQRRGATAPRHRDDGWIGKVRIERSF